jgi:hypothetical protein
MGMTIDEHLEFEDDKLYHYYPLPQYGDGICKKDLVMTKEIFIACYKRWIKGVEDGNDKATINE